MSLTISLTPAQVEQRLSTLGVQCYFTPEERAKFETIPVVDTPERVFGFPTPVDNAALTLENIKNCVGIDPARQPAFFEHAWYQGEEFTRTRCAPGWHLLTMDVVPDSLQQPHHYLHSLGVTNIELPAAVEVVLMLFLHYVGSGEQLLLKKHTWCSDSASFDRRVTVGAFGRNGVFISGHPSNFASRGLGICGKIPVP
jgi:hypothetical protein